MQERILNALKGIYKKLPVNYKMKNKLKGIFYRMFGFLLKNTTSYRVWNSLNTRIVRDDIVKVDAGMAEKFQCDKKIAVQLHLYYVDLLDEFVSYFKNIPYDFDVLVSIVKPEAKAEVERKLQDVKHVRNVYVEIVENRGRDVAPLLSVFGSRILEYDYICHIHSKKSLFTGGEQTAWRLHLLDGLMGSEMTVRKHFYLMETGENVGMLYPETFPGMPYMGHTWLQNKGSRDELLARIQVMVKSNDIYIDYPMGTMFWAKVDAIRQFFAAGIRVDEFPKEGGQTDGTIAHAFERCLPLVCKYNEYNYVIFDEEQGNYSYNCGLKNLNQYYVKNYEQMKAELSSYDVISFDIFDTLVSRKISNPKAILNLVELKLDKELEGATDFKEKRLQAELQYRRKNPDKDCDIDEIYEELEKSAGWDAKMAAMAKNMEIELELALVEPKGEVQEVFRYEVEQSNKEIYLVSDMQLGRKEIDRLLEQSGIAGFKHLYLSSECDKRKDNGTMWEYFRQLYGEKNCIHVGDNEVSDVQIPGDYDVKSYHLMSAKALFQTSNMGRCIGELDDSRAADSVELGLILNRLFSEPLAYNETKGCVKNLNASEFGYSFMGPVVLNYVLWIMKEAADKQCGKIFFCAREGHLLKQVYDAIAEHSGCHAESEYLYVSRRALSMAAIETEADMELPLEIYYEGKLENLLKSRFGLELADVPDEDIKLPDNKNKVLKFIQPWKEEILTNARVQRENYLRYLGGLLPESDTEPVMLSDIGYSGTIQYYLSKIAGRGFDGRYLATDDKKKPLALQGNTIEGYYIDNDAEQEISSSNIHRYHLILESILIAPDGQLLYMDDMGRPVFESDGNVLFDKQIEEMHKGIVEYAKDYAGIMKEVLLAQLPQKRLAEQLMYCLVRENILSWEAAASVRVDDKYCSGTVRNAIDYYREGNKR